VLARRPPGAFFYAYLPRSLAAPVGWTEHAGNQPNTLVTVSAEDVPMRDGLEKLLSPAGLRLVVREQQSC